MLWLWLLLHKSSRLEENCDSTSLNISTKVAEFTKYLNLSILLSLFFKHHCTFEFARVPFCQKLQKLVEDMGLSPKQPTYIILSDILREATYVFMSDILREWAFHGSRWCQGTPETDVAIKHMWGENQLSGVWVIMREGRAMIFKLSSNSMCYDCIN